MKPGDLTPTVEALARHIRRRGADYYPHLASQPFEVRLVRARRRQFAKLCEFELRGPAWRQLLLAKVTLTEEETECPAAPERIRSYFVGSSDPRGAEFAALSAVKRHFDACEDPRLFAVRVLDSVLDDQALILEKVAALPLSQLLKSSSRLSRSRSEDALLEATHRAGACLREFHRIPVGERRRERGTTKADFLSWVQASREFFAQDRSGSRFLERVQPRIARAAERLLPDELPAGSVHDDFAPRNVLVDAEGRVAMIDLLEEWAGCVWEDVAHFLVSLGTNKLQAISGGRLFSHRLVESLRQTFLDGYFADEPVPWPIVRLYEAQIALTKWGAAIDRSRRQRGPVGVFKRWQVAVSSRWYAKYVEACLRHIEHEPTGLTRPWAAAPQMSAGGRP